MTISSDGLISVSTLVATGLPTTAVAAEASTDAEDLPSNLLATAVRLGEEASKKLDTGSLRFLHFGLSNFLKCSW